MPKLKQSFIWKELELEKKQYLLLTLHRPSNIDYLGELNELLSLIVENINKFLSFFLFIPVRFRIWKNFNKTFSNLKLISPLGYVEFIYLVKNAFGVITDSGEVRKKLWF